MNTIFGFVGFGYGFGYFFLLLWNKERERERRTNRKEKYLNKIFEQNEKQICV